MGSDVVGNMRSFQATYATQATTLIAQALVTIAVIYNLDKHWKLFPIRQLSPLCTLVALISFFLLNLIGVIARVIQTEGGYYEWKDCNQIKPYLCGQCRLFDHVGIKTLALINAGLRQLPLILFAVKTLRVCVCFLDYKTVELPRILKWLFGKESTMVLVCIFYSMMVSGGAYLDLLIGQCSQTEFGAVQTFEFFCPKQSGTVDWITTLFRYILLAISYTLSIRTYRQLDFKRFIFIIFLFSNLQVVLRFMFILMGNVKFTYHEFYYHSMFLNLCGTLILYPYSNYNRYVQQPPLAAAVLQSFEAFLNYAPGIGILQYYALNCDQIDKTSRYSHCFDSFIAVRQLKMVATLHQEAIPQMSEQMHQILTNSDTAAEIPEVLELRQRSSQGRITLGNIKVVEKRLSQFCERHLFKEWKKTESRVFIQKQFEKNLVINEKMSELGIDIGY